MSSDYEKRKKKIEEMEKIISILESENGAEQFDEKDLLEIFLKYIFNKRDNAEQISAEMIDKFGSVRGLFFAPIEELCEIKDMGKASSEYLSCMCDILRDEFFDKNTCFLTVPKSTITEYCVNKLKDCKNETILVVYMSPQYKPICIEKYTDNRVDSVKVDIDRIIKKALEVKSAGIIVFHNHPGGVASPSSLDISNTRRMALDLKEKDIGFYDHIIVGNGSYCSLRRTASYDDLFD